MDQQRPIPTERLRTIRGQMVERFSLDELRDLTFELGLDWDQLPGSNKSAKTTELLDLLNRRTQLPLLLERLEAMRSGEPWALDDLDESAASPYKGLEYYDEDDDGLFFGRERLIATLLDALRGQSLLAVVGASGSGKSSVVRAGVVPVLRGTRPPPEGTAPLKGSAGWDYLVLTPTDRPLEQLALTLTRDLDTVGETRAIIRDLAEDPAALHLYLRKYLERQKKPRAFLLVDQFEELFTLCKDEAARGAFIGGLLAAAGGGSATVVLTLRADFYHHCLRYPGLRDALQQRQLIIGAMDEAELRAAVAEPAARTGYELEPGLADKIVRDAGDEAGALPLLSHALLETWRRREGRRLTYAGYNDAGGVGGAIARTAERAYGDLDPAQQTVARRIFLQLTELGEGAEDTRRRVGLDDLLPGDGAARREAEAVLHALSRARLVSADDAAAQVSHEALIREWPALQEWLRDNREALRLERRLAAAAAEWDDGRRDPSYLYDGTQLAAACQWAETNPTSVSGTVRAFLDAATEEEEREAAEREAARRQRERLTRRAFVGVSAFAALAMLAAVFAFLQRNTATASEERAVAAQSTTAYEATRAEVNLNEAIAAKATADFNEQQAEIERDRAVTALNDSTARLLMNLSEDVFESDPLLAERLLLEAMTSAGSNDAAGEAAKALVENLRTGRGTQPLTASVSSFSGVGSGTVYVVHYQLGKDGLISGATGATITMLSGDVDEVTPIPDSPLFVVRYYDAPDELRRTDDGEQIIALSGDVEGMIYFADSPLFIVRYYDAPNELRRTDDGGQIVTLSGAVDQVHPIPDSPFFVVSYFDAPDELRRTDDQGQIVALSGDVKWVNPIPDSPFFVVGYRDAPGELRRTDDVGQIVALSGEVYAATPIPDSPFFVVRYSDAPAELRRTDGKGQIVTLSREVYDATPFPDSPFFVVWYQDAPDELRRTDDGEQIVALSGVADLEAPFPGSPFFVVSYFDAPAELRRTDDMNQIVALSGRVTRRTPISDSPFFVVEYSDAPGELRRMDNGEHIGTLSGRVAKLTVIPDSPFFVVEYSDAPDELRRTDDPDVVSLAGEVADTGFWEPGVISIPDSPFFVVDYSDAPDELRRTDTGEVVSPVSGERLAANADVLNAERGYYRILFQDGTSEIVSGDRALVDLGPGAQQSLYFPETNRAAVRYGDGRVVYIDLNLLEALGGADAEDTLADMSLEDLVAQTCDVLFTRNPEWDEAKLDEYLVFLPEGRARACGE